jgi:hypothetical protein
VVQTVALLFPLALIAPSQIIVISLVVAAEAQQVTPLELAVALVVEQVVLELALLVAEQEVAPAHQEVMALQPLLILENLLIGSEAVEAVDAFFPVLVVLVVQHRPLTTTVVVVVLAAVAAHLVLLPEKMEVLEEVQTQQVLTPVLTHLRLLVEAVGVLLVATKLLWVALEVPEAELLTLTAIQ